MPGIIIKSVHWDASTPAVSWCPGRVCHKVVQNKGLVQTTLVQATWGVVAAMQGSSTKGGQQPGPCADCFPVIGSYCG